MKMKELKRTEMVEKFRNAVRELYDESPDYFEAELYWDYRDSIDPDMVSFGEDARNELENELYSLNIDCISEVLDEKVHEIISTFQIWGFFNVFEEFDLELEKEEFLYPSESNTYAALYNIVNEYVHIDILKGIIDKSSYKVNIIPEQKDNLNSEGSEMMYDIENIIVNTLNSDFKGYYQVEKIDKFTNKNLQNKLLANLFKSQGYDVSDLKNEVKVRKSRFLTSMKSEIDNMTIIGSAFLVFLLDMSLDELLKINENIYHEITVKPETTVGLFNPVHGSGSLLGVELEKEFKFSLNDVEIQIEKRRSNYGYTVNSVYGLITSCWSNKYYIA